MPGSPTPFEVRRKRGTARADRAPLGGTVTSIAPLRRDRSRCTLAEALEASLQAAYWLGASDELTVMLLRDAVAERDELRGRAGGATADPADRRQLRSLDKEIASLLTALGLTPTSRVRFGAAVAPAEPDTKLDEFITRRRASLDEIRAMSQPNRRPKPPSKGA